MDTAGLKRFAQAARRLLMEQTAVKLDRVLLPDHPARRENPKAMQALDAAILARGKPAVVEQVAYTWFNRFCALRFMDANRYTRIGVISPAEGQSQPEILAEAKMGHVDEEMVPEATRKKVLALLGGQTPSRDPQGEAYRLLVVAACNDWHRTMPFLFERIDDYTELLMPEDLLSEGSILAQVREAMTPEACHDVEVIGWLYQFYISEKKDEVFEGLKKNKKVTPENIPAATQLFTPNWIVRYLVENSLGRLWMLNRPNSRLAETMDYYIKPEVPESDFLRVGSVEEIKVCDPACGSGHMLVYAFDLLYAIYEEEGFDPSEIPEKILTKNLFGVEIDERAGELAALALMMKAREKQKRFFRRIAQNPDLQPNICVLENVSFADGELAGSYADFVGKGVLTESVIRTLRQFEEADNFGSLIRPELQDASGLLAKLKEKDASGNLFVGGTHRKVLKALEQADYLSQKYHVVVANPPYMGGKGMNPRLGAWAKENYPDSKSDLFAMFIERGLGLSKPNGYAALVTMQAWMFLSSYESLRHRVLERFQIAGLIQIGYNSFPELNSKIAQACAFIIRLAPSQNKGEFLNLNDSSQSADKQLLFKKRRISKESLYHVSASDLMRIPGMPIVYWISERIRSMFSSLSSLGQLAQAKQGLASADNDRFLRLWSEVEAKSIGFGCRDREVARRSGCRWFPYNKGGEFRKWFGNQIYVVDWLEDGAEIRSFVGENGRLLSRPQNMDFYFLEAVSWSDVTTSVNAFRYFPFGFINDATGHSAFGGDAEWKFGLLGYCNTKFVNNISKLLNPSLHFHVGYFNKIPYAENVWTRDLIDNSKKLVEIAENDWDRSELSWGFSAHFILTIGGRKSLEICYESMKKIFMRDVDNTSFLESENNRIFIEAYGLQDELTPDVPLSEITLTCNPHYRYGGDKSEEELEALLLADTMKEFISYAVGCMFGRYSLDKPGLILANQGDTFQDYLKQIPNPTFPADEDNVIPIIDGDWFTDDVTERFRKFLRVTFGDEHYEENLEFLEKAIGKDIRKYFVKDFYNDHVKRYKKRPIYWLFSSPKGSFNALIYMHRYRKDTVSIVLNDYLREFRTKLTSRNQHLEKVGISATASQSEKTRALKEIDSLKKTIAELDAWERDVMYPLATRQIEIDLDDGVKVNYTKFGTALKKIPGLDVSED